METSDAENSSGLGGCLNPDPVLIVPDVWDKLIAEYSVSFVLDVGCGYGHAVKWFLDRHIYAWGFEGFRPAIDHTAAPGFVTHHDFTQGPPRDGLIHFDLCWCCEFVEHVEERFIPNFIRCFRACRHIAMTHATPGQGGFHHVNEQPAEYWIGALTAYGFSYDDPATKKFRRPAKYGVNNLLIFHNP